MLPIASFPGNPLCAGRESVGVADSATIKENYFIERLELITESQYIDWLLQKHAAHN